VEKIGGFFPEATSKSLNGAEGAEYFFWGKRTCKILAFYLR
jgi:hypothetical protein